TIFPYTTLFRSYMQQMADIVADHHGVVKQFAGDAVMAIFGIPVPRESEPEIARDAVNAVRCALAMGQELIMLNQSWQKKGLPMVSMRVGIFTGSMVAGSVGSSERLEYTVVGDSVNTAARLEQFNKEILDP